MDFSSKDFKKLQKEWNKRLKASGFDDVEAKDGNKFGKSAIGISGPRYTQDQIDETTEYYSAMTTIFYNNPPKNKALLRAMELYLDGSTTTDALNTARSEGFKLRTELLSNLIAKYKKLICEL